MAPSFAPPCAVINRLGFLLNACEPLSLCATRAAVVPPSVCRGRVGRPPDPLISALEFLLNAIRSTRHTQVALLLLTYTVGRYGAGLVVGAGENSCFNGTWIHHEHQMLFACMHAAFPSFRVPVPSQ